MLKQALVVGMGAATVLAAPAQAATFVSVGGPASFAAPVSAAAVINFNVGVPAGLSGNYIIQSGSNSLGASPFGSDGSRYLSVAGSPPNGPSATLMFGGAYSTFSLYWGSIDTYNTLELLDTAGNLIGTVASSTFTGIQVGPPANGAQGLPATNRRVTFTKSATDAMIGGIRLNSTQNSFEIDNVALGAVPEPATWAMMILGFGAIGGAMRARRRTRVAFA
jgi:PEP-CTERM motif